MARDVGHVTQAKRRKKVKQPLEPYTVATLTAHTWENAPPPDECVGAFLRTRAGSCYRIEEARELPSGSWRLKVTRWPPDEVPGDAMVFDWYWRNRAPTRKRARAK